MQRVAMVQPLARVEHYVALLGDPPAPLAARLPALLAEASRIVRAEAQRVGVDIDTRIATEELDGGLVADIVCRMVNEAAITTQSGAAGLTAQQMGSGPFTFQQQFANPSGRLWLGKDARRLLGLNVPKAWSVDMAASASVHPLEWLP